MTYGLVPCNSGLLQKYSIELNFKTHIVLNMFFFKKKKKNEQFWSKFIKKLSSQILTADD